jgi:thiol-disulfide isomerase/thioredoxin
MEEPTITWKIFSMYMLLILFILLAGHVSAQVTVTQYNAGWNGANDVKWLKDLEDCDITKVDIVKKPKQQKKHKIVVVPTIIVFKDGEEVKRFQADISFSMKATRKELQDIINEQLMSDF